MYNLLPYQILDGKKNMEIDANILDYSIESESAPILRLYGWDKPTLTLGRNQPLDSVGVEYCQNNNIDVLRRITGGRAVLHHLEITYSFVCKADFLEKGSTVISSYKEISEALIVGLDLLGIKLSFPEYKKVSVDKGFCMALSTGSDLNYNGKKIIGSAQYRKNNYILQHGSILIDIDDLLHKAIFEDYYDKNTITSLTEINPNIDYYKNLPCFLKKGFESKFNDEFTYNAELAEMLGLC
ncbi:MAG: lipoate--protein ligase family protein [bacterium]